MAYEYSFTQSNVSSVNNLTNAFRVPLIVGSDGVSSNGAIGTQIIRVSASTTAASQTAEVCLILVETTQTGVEKLARFPAVVTSSAFRTNTAGSAANGYIATVAFSETGNSKLDVLGHGETVVSITSDGVYTKRGTKLEWYISCTTLSSGNMTVWVHPTRAL